MDNVLHKKIVDAVKGFMSDSVTLVEGFVSVQINGSDFRHIHISYRDLSLDPDESNSPSEAVTPPVVVPKVSRRKAYMPIKCRAGAEQEPDVTILENQQQGIPPRDDSCHLAEEDDEDEEKAWEGCNSERSSSRHSHLQHLLLPEAFPIRTDPPALPHPTVTVIDSDPIGPLNAESIQASMHRVMQPSYSGLSAADLHLTSMAMNAIIPIPTFMATAQPRSKTPAEQRKIKPKPMISGRNLSNTGPYTKPQSGLSKRHPNKEFSCNQCHLKFKSLHNLTEHTTSVHICFRCTTCNAKFTQRSNLQRHSLKHLGFKPFRCAVCLKEYYRKDHLVRHVEVSHPGAEPKASIVNILPSAECLRILEETQSKAHDAQELQSATPSASSCSPKATTLDQSDLNSVLSPAPSSLTIPAEDLRGVVNLAEDGVESEEDGEEIDDEDDFGMEVGALFTPPLSIPMSHNRSSTSDCSIANNLTS